MATTEISWTAPGADHADILVSYDPSTVDSNGDVVVTSASGTYQILDANDNVVRTDSVTGLIPANSFIFAPDNKINIAGQTPFVDTNGLGVLIDNKGDADQIGPNNTPEVELLSDVFGDYRELTRGAVTDVSLQQSGAPTGGGGGGTTGGGGSGGVSSGGGGTGGGTTTTGGETITTRADGSHLVNVQASGQTLTSDFFDTFQNHGDPSNTFVFDPGHGLDIVKLFRVNGADHDTLSFQGSDFGNSIAEVLHNTRKDGNGVTILDPTSGDTVKLTGITKAQLVHNQSDFTFHA